MRRRVLIIGAGMATAYLLQELAAHQHELDICVIGDESRACYNRVMLSSVLAGDVAEGDLDMLGSLEGYPDINFRLGTRVEKVNLRARTVITDHGDSLPYDLLVFATGASVARPELDHAWACGVEVLRTVDDLAELQAHVTNGARAVVVGGGLLGLEAAHGLNELGLATTVLHRQSWLMNRQLDRKGGDLLCSALENKGIAFCLENSVAAIEVDNERLSGITLGGGERLSCELLVFATGISPNKMLAESAGLECNRGVRVDDNMRTSDGRCYALGECSQVGEQCFGLVAPIRQQAEVLARRLVGAEGSGFLSQDWPTQLKISGLDIFSAGPVECDGETLILKDRARGVYRRLVLRQGCLKSAVLVGDKSDGNWYLELIRSASDVSGIRQQLMFGRDVCDAVKVMSRAA